MKRLLTMLLCAVLLFGLFACGGGDQQIPETTAVPTTEDTLTVKGEGFRVGFGRAIITPEENLPLGGFGTSSTRVMNDVLDDTYVTCIAMTDEQDNTYLLMLVDLQRIEDVLIELLRVSVTDATGIPGENITISCSHTHSIPDLTYDTHEGIQRYKNLLTQRFAQAAQAAIADSLPATMYVGSRDAEGLNFVKHYQHTDENGQVQYFGDNFGVSVIDDTTHHVTEAYNAMHMLQFKREGGKDIVISNFRSHPTLTGGSSELNLSSDFIGPMRDAVETELDCHFAFMQGACGNINPRSRLSNENFGTEENHVEYGYRLAQVAVACIREDMQEKETGRIQSEKILFEAKVDHSGDALIPYAKLVQQYWKDNNRNHTLTNAYGRPYGISSYYHASAIILKAQLPQTQQIELDVFSIGDTVGFFSAPGELFDLMSIEMEEASPFDMTYTVGFANGDWKYFPYGPCAQYASYESDYGRFEVGTTAEGMMDTWLETLNKFHTNAAE